MLLPSAAASSSSSSALFVNILHHIYIQHPIPKSPPEI